MTPRHRGRRMVPVVVAALAALGVGALGALVTTLDAWYYALRKPAWQPPDWLFGPAWTLIFGLAAIAAILGWRHAVSGAERRRMVVAFGVNAALNVGWSLLFFRLQRPDWALGEVLLLWASIVALIAILWPISRLAAGLLAPYLAWVTFATALNAAIYLLNRPFA